MTEQMKQYFLKIDIQIKEAWVLFGNLHVFQGTLALRKAQHITENQNTHLQDHKFCKYYNNNNNIQPGKPTKLVKFN